LRWSIATRRKGGSFDSEPPKVLLIGSRSASSSFIAESYHINQNATRKIAARSRGRSKRRRQSPQGIVPSEVPLTPSLNRSGACGWGGC
jgi:hypothetical protein